MTEELDVRRGERRGTDALQVQESPAAEAVPVHRRGDVRDRISCGNCGRQGTSASGEDPTEVSGSVSSQA
jgi:hypothetical protein